MVRWHVHSAKAAIKCNRRSQDVPMERAMYDKVFPKAKALEALLKQIGATGKGLHEKLSSVEHMVPAEHARLIRKVASIRNALAHEEDCTIDLLAFDYAADTAISYLESVIASAEVRSKPDSEPKIVFLKQKRSFRGEAVESSSEAAIASPELGSQSKSVPPKGEQKTKPENPETKSKPSQTPPTESGKPRSVSKVEKVAIASGALFAAGVLLIHMLR